ncbi:MAG: FMN reductase [Bacteroidetes bacterium HGW-Bacteroidetes-23]|nr:MAG: FMN reductase [Bacteroidetes bacterium HGW-Bacteroidetes-23]
MKNKIVVILGSSRKDGKTRDVIDNLNDFLEFDSIDLNDYEILIFATPVYWYSMSGIMKVFFDRFTDLLDNHQELGRKLRTKKMAILSSSIGNNLGETFWIPFIETANYLGMNYIGNLHTIENEDSKNDIATFAKLIESKI